MGLKCTGPGKESAEWHEYKLEPFHALQFECVGYGALPKQLKVRPTSGKTKLQCLKAPEMKG